MCQLNEKKKRTFRSLKKELVEVSWNPTWGPEKLQNTRESLRRSLQMFRVYHGTKPSATCTRHTHLNDLQKQAQLSQPKKELLPAL
jgi:hypothetical protein